MNWPSETIGDQHPKGCAQAESTIEASVRGNSAIFGTFDSTARTLEAMSQALSHRGSELSTRRMRGFTIGSRYYDDRPHLANVGDCVIAFAGAPFVIDRSDRLARFLDAEALGASFRRFGADFFRTLHGSFALAIWIPDQNTILLVRDSFGSQSLAFATGNGTFDFASEYKALARSPRRSRRIDRIAVDHFVGHGWAPAGHTFFKSISMVPPGSMLTWTDGHIEVEHFRRDIDRHQPPLRPIPPEKLAACATEAITWHSQDTENRYGVMLSSGVDSAFMTATLKHLYPHKELHSFTVGYGQGDPELLGAKETSEHLGTIHHEIIVQPKDLTSLLRRTIEAVDNPGGYEEFPCLYALHKFASNLVDVMFSGNVADTLFAGMPYHRDLPSGDGAIYRRLCQDLLHRDERLGAQELLAGHFGLSFRMPFAENSMIDLALETPDFQKLGARENKIIFRQAAAMILPEEITSRPKRIQHLQYDKSMWHWIAERVDWLRSERLLETHDLLLPQVEAALRHSACHQGDVHTFRPAWNAIAVATWASIYLETS
ncbi:asparagine synthetase B [Rhizobium sp. ZPR3]|uniref:asparagine synthase (glutamine-hydrolyzing) n=2 Tax=unclassified Rhizobium TaxID=2613769 RepID=A0AAU7SR27_9HYPH